MCAALFVRFSKTKPQVLPGVDKNALAKGFPKGSELLQSKSIGKSYPQYLSMLMVSEFDPFTGCCAFDAMIFSDAP